MKDLEFPLFKTKSDVYKKFDLADPKSRMEYFEYKAGPEIKKLREYLANNTFIAYLMGKKSSGKIQKKGTSEERTCQERADKKDGDKKRS